MPRIFRSVGLLPALLLVGCDQGGGIEASPNANTVDAPAAGTVVSADEQAPAAGAEADLLKLEEDYAQALIKKDRAFLMAYYAPDWRGGNWLGFWTKSTMLKAVLDERYVVRSMKLRDTRVKVVGQVAIVQGISDEVTAVDGKETTGKWSFTDVFAFRDGKWVATASHTSEVKQRP